MTGLKLKDKFTICIQNTHPVLNLNGQICLKAMDSCEIVEMPTGCGDFIKCSVRYQRANLVEDLKKKKVSYVHCVGCENYFVNVLDPFLLGLVGSSPAQE